MTALYLLDLNPISFGTYFSDVPLYSRRLQTYVC